MSMLNRSLVTASAVALALGGCMNGSAAADAGGSGAATGFAVDASASTPIAVYTPERPPTPAQPVMGMQETQRYADADMAAVLEALTALGAQPISKQAPQAVRNQPTPADAVKAVLRQQGRSTAPEPVASTRDIMIPGSGGPIQARVYVPQGAASDTSLPLVAYWHGGGWVIANIDTYDASARALANKTGAIIVSADYRQGPEHKFPAAHEDAWAAYRWIVNNAASLGGDPRRIAVAGESAGGNLAANVAIRARDERFAMPVHQLLVYPVASGSLNTPSYIENQMAMPLSRAAMNWFFEHYLPEDASRRDPRINLIEADLRGLPPATIVTAELDPLRWEGRTLAERLRTAGAQVEDRTYDGVTHEFFGMAAVVDDAKAAQQFAADAMRRGLGTRASR